ncbi:hypothetical protein JCM3766R1_006020 [Sporobolomyces carnicolor]
MASRKSAAFAAVEAVESSSTPDPSTANGVLPSENGHRDEPGVPGADRTGDDQQISQILAEMAQSNSAPNSASGRSTRPSRVKRHSPDEALSGPPSASSVPALPNISTVASPLVAPGPLPAESASQSADSRVQVARDQSRGESAEQDELETTGDGENGENGPGTSAQGAKNRGKKGERRARGNGDEHKGMTEAEWEASRKANHKEVERRRRETINAGLDALAALLPPTPAPPPGPAGSARAAKPNKSEILGQGIEYIHTLKRAHHEDSNRWGLEKVLKDQEIKRLQAEVDKLKETNNALIRRVEELEAGAPTGGDGPAAEDDAERANKKRRLEGEAV